MLNSGLDALQINTVEQKRQLLNIRLTTQQEERSFDLSLEEKENILRLITSQVSASQLQTYEEYGVPLYNATSWQITPEHKKSLLELAENLISVEDKEGLFNIGRENLEKFPLSGKQEQILKTLAPLQREYSYSESLLNKLQSLPSRQFLIQREIIPLQHQKTTDPYKELKKKVLAKKYKEISWEIKEKEKAETTERAQRIRNSLLPSLLFFAQMNSEDLAYQEYRLSKETFGEREDWVSIGAIDSQQRDLLFLSGFKSMPKYYFFDLLFFVVENIHQEVFTFDWKQWKNISPNFSEELVREWVINGFTYETCKEWIDIGLTVQDSSFAQWLRDTAKLTPEETLNNNSEELRNQFKEYEQHYLTEILLIFDGLKDKATGTEKEALKGIIKIISNENLTQERQLEELKAFLNKFPSDNPKLNSLVEELEKMKKKHSISFSGWNGFLSQYPNLREEWEKYLELVKERENRELQRKAEWLNSFTSAGKSGSISAVPNISHLEEKYERLAGAYERIRDYLESEGVPEKKPTESTTSQPSSSTSAYDDLFNSLDKEEQERLKKKKAREEARKKLSEKEFSRREANLSEKEKKAAEDAEKRAKEKELEEQEAEVAQKRQEERDKNIAEDRQAELDKDTIRIEKAKKRAEEELKFQEERIKKEKEKKEQEIEEMKQKNEQEEREIAQKRELMEQELAKELENIAIEDKRGRQLIEEKFKKRLNENQKKMDALKRKNDDELKEKEAAAIKERQENEEELRKLREDVRIQNEQAQKAKEAADAQERLLSGERDKRVALDRLRKELYDAVMDYVFTEEEGRKGTRSPQKGYGYLRSFLDDSPSMEFNLDFGDLVEVNKSNSTYRKAIQVFRKVVGNKFVTKGELRNLINEKVQSLDFLR